MGTLLFSNASCGDMHDDDFFRFAVCASSQYTPGSVYDTLDKEKRWHQVVGCAAGGERTVSQCVDQTGLDSLQRTTITSCYHDAYLVDKYFVPRMVTMAGTGPFPQVSVAGKDYVGDVRDPV